MSDTMRLLIAYDGSTHSDAALSDLRRAGLPKDAEATVVTAVEEFLTPPGSFEAAPPALAQSRRVSSALAAAEARARQTLAEAEAKIGEAAARLREDFPSWRVGAEAAARAVARRRWPEGSEAYVVAADERVRPTTLAAQVSAAAGAIAESNEEKFAEVTAGVEAAAGMLSDAGLKVSAEVRKGEARRVLLDAAEGLKADCIFVGSRGLSGRLERWRLGSVAAEVAPRAPCSVEVVREKEQAEQGAGRSEA
jgi:nucleotide-binding universal stress UspA family protein